MCASSVLEAEAASPLPTDLTSETGTTAKKRSAAFLGTVSIAFGRHLKAAATRPSCSPFMMKSKLHSPKNPAYAAIRDTGSMKGALDSMLMKLRAAGIPVSLEEMRNAFC